MSQRRNLDAARASLANLDAELTDEAIARRRRVRAANGASPESTDALLAELRACRQQLVDAIEGAIARGDHLRVKLPGPGMWGRWETRIGDRWRILAEETREQQAALP